MIGVFIFFWFNAKKHEREELARLQRQKQEREHREAAARVRSAHQRAEYLRATPAIKLSPPPTVATPRKAAPAPVVRRVVPAPTPAPASDTTLMDMATGYVVGKAIESLLSSTDDRPAPAPAPFESGGGGDFGGGGASGSWGDSSSSSDSSSFD